MKLVCAVLILCSAYALGQDCAGKLNSMTRCIKNNRDYSELKARCEDIEDDEVNACFVRAGCTEPTMEAMMKKKMDEKMSGNPMASMMMQNMPKPDMNKMKQCGKDAMPELQTCMDDRISWMKNVQKPSESEMEEKMEQIMTIMKSKMIGMACDNNTSQMRQVRNCLQNGGRATNINAIRRGMCDLKDTCKASNGELPESCKRQMQRAGCECGKTVMPDVMQCTGAPDFAVKMATCMVNKKPCDDKDGGKKGGPMGKMNPMDMMEKICSEEDFDMMGGEGFMGGPPGGGGNGGGPPPEVQECMGEAGGIGALLGGGNSAGGNPFANLFGANNSPPADTGPSQSGPASIIERLFNPQGNAGGSESAAPGGGLLDFFRRGRGNNAG